MYIACGSRPWSHRHVDVAKRKHQTWILQYVTNMHARKLNSCSSLTLNACVPWLKLAWSCPNVDGGLAYVFCAYAAFRVYFTNLEALQTATGSDMVWSSINGTMQRLPRCLCIWNNSIYMDGTQNPKWVFFKLAKRQTASLVSPQCSCWLLGAPKAERTNSLPSIDA